MRFILGNERQDTTKCRNTKGTVQINELDVDGSIVPAIYPINMHR